MKVSLLALVPPYASATIRTLTFAAAVFPASLPCLAQSEPRGLMVRGMETSLNLIMINGNQAAAASSTSTNRTFEFDQITIDNLESIEVYKAAIPSMPANSIGGTAYNTFSSSGCPRRSSKTWGISTTWRSATTSGSQRR